MPSRTMASKIKKAHVKKLRAKMPFHVGSDEKKATTWRQKQGVYVQAGLRALKAPMVLCSQRETVAKLST